MTNRIPVGVFFALFTISGFAGLIYESIWSHYLKLFLGHAAYAQTLVLAIFMGGMALGSWLVSRFTHRIANLLLGYAIAELGIGLLAVSFHAIFQAVTGWAFDSVLPALGGSGGVDAFKWTLASVLILPASILLGTTFPLMSAGIIRLYPDQSGRALSMLYFTNSFGAAAGVLASGFYLIDKLGLPGTILTAGILNITLALFVWAITKRLPPVAPAAVPAAPRDGAGAALGRVVLLLAFATGAASFIYEITWIRMLTMGLGASTHAFEVMLSAFILGMSLGAFWFRNRIQGLASDTAWLAGLLVAKALLAIYAIWIYSDVLAFIQWVMQATDRTDAGYVMTTFAGLVASMVVMLPTAFCAGMTLPLATHVLTSRGLGEASIGRVYGANTAGCIVGAAFATHVGMELLGVKGLTGLGALLDVGVGVLVLAATAAAASRRRAIAAMATAGVVGLAGFLSIELDQLRMSSGVFRYGVFADPTVSKVQYYKDGKTATISVIDIKGLRTIRTNGKPDASVAMEADRKAAQDEGTMVLAGALPLALKPDAVDVANIGFGSGLTTHTLLGSPKLKVVDTIEIERAMIEGAKWFSPRNDRAYADPRSRIHIEDAKTFFAAHGKLYDFIVSEPSNPWVSGVSTLFSDEFYAQVKRYLKDDGLLIQWVQVYEINVGLLSTVFTALGKNFADYAVYSPTIGDLIVIASPKGVLPPLTGEVFRYKGVADDLAHLGIRDLGDLQALRVGGRKALEPLFLESGFLPNSDYFPVLDQHAPRSRFKRESADDVRAVRERQVPLLAMLDGEFRTPLSRLADVGENRPVRISKAVGGAEAIGVMLTGAASRAASLPPLGRMQAAFAHAGLADCSGAEIDWVDAVNDVILRSAPYLEGREVATVFERIEASKCWKGLDETSRRRVSLLKAINARDAVGMRTHAEALLERLDPALESERGMLVLAAMTGHLAGGDRASARAVWDRNSERLTVPQRQDLVTRLAVAHASAAADKGPKR